MTVFKKEMKKGLIGLVIWTGIVVFMLLVCLLMYPEMKGQMNEMNEMFASMGSFTKAFGMDSLDFGTLIGFYGVECGNMLGLGGGMFAAFLGVNMLAKEENAHTAEFLLTHPIKRSSVFIQKGLATLVQITILNVVVYVISIIGVVAIGEEMPWKELTLIVLGYYILQIELAGICLGISAFVRKGSIAFGIGVAALLYFLNIIRNISDSASFLKYITPYSYAEPSSIVADGKLDLLLICIGSVYTVIAIVVGLKKYISKDMAS